MTFLEFDKYQEDLIKEVIKMRDTKGKEYANSESRFANFDRLSVRLNIKNTQVGLVYLTKHMDAIESYIARGRTYSTETIQGRIVDAITYLTLIGGMILEETTNKESKCAHIVVRNFPLNDGFYNCDNCMARLEIRNGKLFMSENREV